MRQDGDSMARYFGKLKSVWLELSEYDPECELSEPRKRGEREGESLRVFNGFEQRSKLCEKANHSHESSSVSWPSVRSCYPSRIFDELHKMKKLRSRSVDGDHHQIICLFFCVLSLNSGLEYSESLVFLLPSVFKFWSWIIGLSSHISLVHSTAISEASWIPLWLYSFIAWLSMISCNLFSFVAQEK